MKRRTLTALLVALGFLAASGCATYNGPDDFGDSVHQFQAAQTLNPGPAGTEPMTGLDGKYAAKAVKNYQESPRPAHEAASEGLESKVGGQ